MDINQKHQDLCTIPDTWHTIPYKKNIIQGPQVQN
jgi:hypothetical protein